MLSELMTEAEMDRRLLAVSHCDRVDLYGYGPCQVKKVTQIHATTQRGEVLAEEILQNQLGPYVPLMPHAVWGKFGKLETVAPRRLTIPEYEWWRAYKDAGELLTPKTK